MGEEVKVGDRVKIVAAEEYNQKRFEGMIGTLESINSLARGTVTEYIVELNNGTRVFAYSVQKINA